MASQARVFGLEVFRCSSKPRRAAALGRRIGEEQGLFWFGSEWRLRHWGSDPMASKSGSHMGRSIRANQFLVLDGGRRSVVPRCCTEDDGGALVSQHRQGDSDWGGRRSCCFGPGTVDAFMVWTFGLGWSSGPLWAGGLCEIGVLGGWRCILVFGLMGRHVIGHSQRSFSGGCGSAASSMVNHGGAFHGGPSIFIFRAAFSLLGFPRRATDRARQRDCFDPALSQKGQSSLFIGGESWIVELLWWFGVRLFVRVECVESCVVLEVDGVFEDWWWIVTLASRCCDLAFHLKTFLMLAAYGDGIFYELL